MEDWMICDVEWCNRTIKVKSNGQVCIHCTLHNGRYERFGTPTPIVKCFGCPSEFQYTYPGTSVTKQGNGPQKHWCVECTSLSEQYADFLKEVSFTHILHFYKLTKIDYLNFLIDQNFTCAMCEETGKLVVDHDHGCCPGNKSCGKCVRGLLCYNCNIFMGKLDSNPGIYHSALKYKLSYETKRAA